MKHVKRLKTNFSSILVALLHHLLYIGFVVVARYHLSRFVAQAHVIGASVRLREPKMLNFLNPFNSLPSAQLPL